MELKYKLGQFVIVDNEYKGKIIGINDNDYYQEKSSKTPYFVNFDDVSQNNATGVFVEKWLPPYKHCKNVNQGSWVSENEIQLDNERNQ